MLNFHGSINGSKYELARLKYRILVVSEVDAFNYIISFVLNYRLQETHIARPILQ